MMAIGKPVLEGLLMASPSFMRPSRTKAREAANRGFLSCEVARNGDASAICDRGDRDTMKVDLAGDFRGSRQDSLAGLARFRVGPALAGDRSGGHTGGGGSCHGEIPGLIES
jgi:hypothetical protein